MSQPGPKRLPQGDQLSARDEAFRRDPYQVLAPLRVEAPVYHDAVGGRYVVTRHADVKALLANRELCVDPRKANPGTYAARLLAANGGAKIELSMIDMDAPDHRRVRSLVTKAFTVSAVEALRPKTRALAEQLLDAVTEPEFDFMPAFADPFPTTVIAEMLGIDPSMRDQFKVWSTITIERFDPTNTAERLAEIVAGEEGLRDLLFHEIAARRAAPRNDLIGRLAEAREGGERLTDKEIVAQCQLLLVAGNTTTSDLIGNGLKNLIERPEQLAYLRAHPDVLPNAVEEMLRYDPSVDCTRRIAHTDLEVAGCPIAKGEYIYLSIASANHDENLYTDPDRFDVRRPQIRHVAFGGGDHLCLGAPLARLEAQEAFRAILGRFRHIGLSPRGHRYRVVPNFRGLKSLWITVATLVLVALGSLAWSSDACARPGAAAAGGSTESRSGEDAVDPAAVTGPEAARDSTAGAASTPAPVEGKPEARPFPKQPGPAKRVEAMPRGPAPLRIDGKLDEPAWATAKPAGDFFRRWPTEGWPSQPTTFRVLYDDQALYFGIVSILAPGEKPRITNLKRDAVTRFWYDDNVQLEIDVAHGKQDLMLFGVNAAGVQLDAMQLDNGRQFVIEWDAQWESASHVEGNVWTVEIKIPASELGGLSRLATIGINVVRNDMMLAETHSWSLIPQGLPLEHTPLYGELHGTDVGTHTPLVAEAYVLGAAPGLADTLNTHDRDYGAKAGLDLRTRLGASTFVEASVLTDFAQVELDNQQLNLDRFALFYPEKRDFFLSGLDVFNFGRAGIAQPLFTRTIGLDANGDIERVWGGLKAYRRNDRFSFGLLDVVTAETANSPLTNWAAGRARVRVGDATSIGVLGTLKQPLTQGTSAPAATENFTAGADFESRFTDRATASGFGSVSATPDTTNPHGVLAGGDLSVGGDVFGPKLSLLYVSRHYDSQTGFVARTDIASIDGLLPVRYFFANERIRALELDVTGGVTTDAAIRHLETGYVSGYVTAETTGSIKPYVSWRALHDVVSDDFALSPALTVHAGTYRSVTGVMGVSTTFPAMVLLDLSYSPTTGFFGGERQSISESLSAPLGQHVLVVENATGAWVKLGDQHDFLYVVNGELDLRASRQLGLEMLATYDSVKAAFQGQARLRWDPIAGTSVFLVYRDDRRTAMTAGTRSTTADDHSLVLKVTSLFNVL